MFKRGSLLGPIRFLVLTLIWVAASSIAVYNASVSTSLAELASGADQRLELYAASLDSELAQFSRLPGILGLAPTIDTLLFQPNNRARQQSANRYLEILAKRTGARVIYILDQRGTVIATSNWRQADSYLGESDAFRPYFQEAIHGHPSRFFGIGTTQSEPGYYLSEALLHGSTPVGVAVVKISLAGLEHTWAASRAQVWISDANHVIILSSRPEWKFATLGAMSPLAERQFEQSRQYNRLTLHPLNLLTVQTLDNSARIVRWTPKLDRFLAKTRRLPGSRWQLTLLIGLSSMYNLAFIRAALAGVLCALLLTGLFLLNERRRRIRDQLVARHALAQAYVELEHKVAERTADLSQANLQLQDQIAERVRAQHHLQQTQSELLQAGKLAVIGQLSTQIAHQLNQPLAALRTLSGNAIKYMARGNLATASSNLETIGQLVERMGKITGSLRAFARKSTDGAANAHLGRTLDSALFLMEQRILQSHARIVRVSADENLVVRCDPNLLEQVLVNLLANALDAQQELPETVIEIHCVERAHDIMLALRDHGPGLSAASLEHLFEPFFTTKPADAGLGLGLVLSLSIINAAGGTLTADNHPEGGALFCLTLPEANKEATDV